MGNDCTKLIEAWFADHNGDGEFVQAARSVPYSVMIPLSSVGRIIFTTKPRIVSAAIENAEGPIEFGMVGRYGLPSETDVRWICEVIAPRGLLFLGDMDPVDLLLFRWLRGCLPLKQITYLGLNDALLDTLEISSTESFSIPCAASEQEALPFLNEVFPDFRETVGTNCVRILEQGRKIELEAMLSATQSAAILQSAVLSNG